MIILSIDVKNIIFSILGGIAIFLFGISLMSEHLKKIAGSKLKLVLEKTTNTPLKGILAGLALTAAIQSSGATVAIVIGLVSADLLSLKNAVGVVLGAKIGTTVTSILISFNLGAYALVIVFIGVIMFLFVKHKTIRNIGGAILGFGLLFLGLNLMGDSLGVLARTESFKTFLISAGRHPVLGLLIGLGATALIQSSSAAIGILQEIYTSGAIPLVVAVAIVLGSNIGNTITSIIAAIKSNSEGKKVAFIHVVISFISSFLFLIIIKPYTMMLEWISSLFGIDHTNSMATIAMSHIIFNVLTVLIMFWFIKQFVWMANKVFRKKDDALRAQVVLNKQLLKASPELALENANKAIEEMGLITIQMFEKVQAYVFEGDKSVLDLITNGEETINELDIDIHNYLVKLGSENLSERQMQKVAKDIDTVTDLERIADHLSNLMEFFISINEEKVPIPDIVRKELINFFDLIYLQLSEVVVAYYSFDKVLANNIIKRESEINTLFKEYRNNNTLRIRGDEQDLNFIYYVDIISNLERIGDHCYNIAENVIHKNFIYTVKEVRA